MLRIFNRHRLNIWHFPITCKFSTVYDVIVIGGGHAGC